MERSTFDTSVTRELLTDLLPEPAVWQLESWRLDSERSHLTIDVCSLQSTCPCPGCATLATRIHSRYGRTLEDLPCTAWRLTLKLTVRKFFCSNPG